MTLAMVAKRAGVSAMTVSHVINNTSKVLDSTRDAVLAAVRDLDYSPNLAARALASVTPNRVGLVYLPPENAFLSSLLLGTLNATNRLGVQLMVRECQSDAADRIIDTIRVLIGNGANAIVLPAPLCERVSGTAALEALAIPTIALFPGMELEDMPSVRIDNFAAARDMTMRLLALGHKRIGFISGTELHFASVERRRGYAAALQAADLEVDADLIRPGDFMFESGLLAAEALLDLKSPPTAVFASNDDMAAAVVSTAHRRGLHVPADLCVTGFDDTPIATKIWPALTTVRQSLSAMSEQAAELLILSLRQNAGRGEIDSIVAPYEIIERESTCRNAAGRSSATVIDRPADVRGSAVSPEPPPMRITRIERPAEPAAIRLYPARAPGSEGMSQVERWADMDGQRIVRNVTDPMLTPFLPDPAIATGAAVIVAPGGAFLFLSIDKEGTAIARALADQGIAAFVLKYRLDETPDDEDSFRTATLRRFPGLGRQEPGQTPYMLDQPLAADDAQQALRCVRRGAEQWGIDPERVGLLGFSAGARAALSVVQRDDPTARPDFIALLYGPLDALEPPSGAPPMFVALAADDRLMAGRGFPLIDRWQAAGCAAELHMFDTGNHGFGIGRPGTTSAQWPMMFNCWLEARGLLRGIVDEAP